MWLHLFSFSVFIWLCWVHWNFKICGLTEFINSGKFSVIICLEIVSHSLCSRTAIKCNLDHLTLSHRSLGPITVFFLMCLFFSVLHFIQFLSLHLKVHWSFPLQWLLLVLSGKIFILYILLLCSSVHGLFLCLPFVS